MDESFEGIILRVFASREADLVLRILSPTLGKISILARNSRKGQKRFGSTPDIFDFGKFEVESGKGSLALLRQFIRERGLQSIRNDLNKLTLSSLLVETVDHLIPDGAHSEDSQLYSYLVAGLLAIDSASSPNEVFAQAFHATSCIVEEAGFLDRAQLGAGSVKRFQTLLNIIEECSERELASKGTVLELLNDFRAAKTA